MPQSRRIPGTQYIGPDRITGMDRAAFVMQFGSAWQFAGCNADSADAHAAQSNSLTARNGGNTVSLSDKLTRPWPVYMETARAMRHRSAFRAFNRTAYGRDHGIPIRNPYAAGAPMYALFGGQHDMGGPGTTDHAAAQSNSLALAVPSPNLDDRSDAWMRHRRVWRGVASISHRNNARRA